MDIAAITLTCEVFWNNYYYKYSQQYPKNECKSIRLTVVNDFHQVRKEIVARNVATNFGLEHSPAAKLNDILRKNLQHKLTSERLQGKKKRMQLEEKIARGLL